MDSLSALPSPGAGVWWAHTLDWLYDLFLSTCSWCVVSAYTWLALWRSLLSTCSWCVVSAIHLIGSMALSPPPPVAGVWWAHTLDWFYDSLSSPPVAGVWWAHWCRCPEAAVASSKWMLHTGGGWGETPPPHMIVKRFGCTTIHKALYKCIIHSLITSEFSKCFDFKLLDLLHNLHQNNVKTQKITFFILVDFNNYHTQYILNLYIFQV